MINYTNIDEIFNSLKLEKISMQSILGIQNNLNKQILVLIKKHTTSLDLEESENDAFSSNINKLTSILSKSNTNKFFSQNLLQNINNMIDFCNSTPNYKENSDELLNMISNYNNDYSQQYKQIYENTMLIEKVLHNFSTFETPSINTNKKFEQSNIVDSSKNTDTSKKIQPSEEVEIKKNTELSKTAKSTKKAKNVIEENEKIKNSDDNENEKKNSSQKYEEKKLIISDMKKKVTLPYNVTELNKILSNKKNKYSTIDDIIEDLYTKPLSYYKAPAISRFKEAYKLITKKEHKSKLKAFSLASEMFFNYNLHPAIITACHNLDELDIYLACLADNQLNDFNCFDIQYEYAPALKKHLSKKEQIEKT